MKYFLVTKTNDGNYVRTYTSAGDLNEPVTKCINAGFKESNKALDDKYIDGNAKYYAVVQGIQVTTKVLSATV